MTRRGLTIIALGLLVALFAEGNHSLRAEQSVVDPRFTPHRDWLDARISGDTVVFETTTFDAHRVVVALFRSSQPERPLLFLIPDLYQRGFLRMSTFARQWQDDMHVAMIVPRGHVPAERDVYHRFVSLDRVTEELQTGERFYLDYRAAMHALRTHGNSFGISPTRACVVAGDYHSNLFLYEDGLSDLDCVVLLSPNESFYRESLTGRMLERRADGLPDVFLITSRWEELQVRRLAEAIPEAQVSVRGGGRGYFLLQRYPDLLGEVRDFVMGDSRPQLEDRSEAE